MRREPLKRAAPRIKLHIPLIKLIKKDQVCYSAAPSTTNQNATQGIYIKDIKWLGNPYRHTILKCSMKMYLKVIGCSCYTCLPRTAPAAAQTAQKMAAPHMDQRLLTNTWPKTRQPNKHTCKQRLTLRNSTTIHKNNKQN